jgi:Uma2 family endonuclease
MKRMATVAPRIQLGPADHGRPLTLEEFREAEETPGYRYELARGVLEVTHVPNDPHGDVEWRILRAIAEYDRQHPGIVHRCGGAASFRLWLPGMASGRNPDVAVVLAGAPRDVRGNRVPALAVEVVSEGSEERDYQVKREEYLAYGLFEYWIVDPFQRKVTVLARDGGQWLERLATGDQEIPSVLLPGLTATVSALWVDPEARRTQADREA